MKKKWPVVLIIVGSILAFFSIFTPIAYKVDSDKKEECANYPPVVAWIEKDLENILNTSPVVVYEVEQNWCNNYYKVRANQKWYKAHYIVRSKFIFNYCWECVECKRLGE